MNVLVITGSRDADYRACVGTINSVWNRLNDDCPVQVTVLYGDCPTGADAAAAMLFPVLGDWPYRRFVADWVQHGNAAGPIRNQQMISAARRLREQGDYVKVLALPARGAKNQGTKDTIKRAMVAGLDVEVRWVKKADK